MKAIEIKEAVRNIPDDAEVIALVVFDECPTCGTPRDLDHVNLEFKLGHDKWQIEGIKEYDYKGEVKAKRRE